MPATPTQNTVPEHPLPASHAAKILKERYQLSDDVQDVLDLALRLAKRRMPHPTLETVQDRELLLAMAYTRRPFSRFDTLLCEMGAQQKVFIRQAKAMVSRPETHAPTHWATCLITEHPVNSAEKRPIAIEHLIEVLFHSQDGAVKSVCQAAGLTHDKLYGAVKALEAPIKSPLGLGLSKKTGYSLAFLARETLEILTMVLLFLVLIKEGLGEMRLIPSESMVPTLQISDRLLVEKVSRWIRPYNRGDVLVFYPPEPEAVLHNDPLSVFLRATGFSSLFHNQPTDPVDKAYIKRLIAKGGDTVQVLPGQGVVLNGRLLDEPYINEVGLACGIACDPITVPEGMVFMMGDNRNQSKDSRFFGFQPANRIVGLALWRVFPLNRIGAINPSP